jgi:Tub family
LKSNFFDDGHGAHTRAPSKLHKINLQQPHNRFRCCLSECIIIIAMSDRLSQSSWDIAMVTRPPPPSLHLRTTTGRVHGVLSRTSQNHRRFLPGNMKQYRFEVQCPGGTTKPIMAAEGSGHTYLIHAMNEADGKIGSHVGTLSRVQMNRHSITYALRDVEGRPITAIVYHVPNPIQVLREPPARRAQMGILPTTAQTNHPAEGVADVNKLHKIFAKSCYQSICQHHDLSQVRNDTAMVLQSKTPHAKSGGRVALNFQGRGRYPSPKNMQLTLAPVARATGNAGADAPEESPPKIYLQMCKWEEQTYHVDFSAPLTFLHAFAFGLAQIDL